jgi:hypothetical protein
MPIMSDIKLAIAKQSIIFITTINIYILYYQVHFCISSKIFTYACIGFFL